MSSVEHRRSRYLNNRAENSHQPNRQRERAMKRFKSSRHAQRFLSAFSGICAHFPPRRHLLSATQWRTEMADRFAVWRQVTALDTAARHVNDPTVFGRHRSKTNCTTTFFKQRDSASAGGMQLRAWSSTPTTKPIGGVDM